MKYRHLLLFIALLLMASCAYAHVNSPDVYFEGFAGPYKLSVVVRAPLVVPGIADIEIHCLGPGVNQIKVVPARITGPGADDLPVPDLATSSASDPQVFRASLWLMQRGAWKVKMFINGTGGPAELALPMDVAARELLPMGKALRVVLLCILLILVAGAVAIMGTLVRESGLPAGVSPDERSIRAGRRTMAIAVAVIIALLAGGSYWWKAEALGVAKSLYRTPEARLAIDGGLLRIHLQNTNGVRWAQRIFVDDIVPDHDHLAHVFIIRSADMSAAAHLHPVGFSERDFSVPVPALPAGGYHLFADVVHRTGFAETYIAELRQKNLLAGKLGPDDAVVSSIVAGGPATPAMLPDGYSMVWINASRILKARQPMQFEFEVRDASGRPATDLEPYMGMAGHAFVVRSDFSVFAHLHPAGSVSMAAFEMAQSKPDTLTSMRHPADGTIPAALNFPYGVPTAGKYRLFVQIRRHGQIETAAFDFEASE
jgi:hypothetical protein